MCSDFPLLDYWKTLKDVHYEYQYTVNYSLFQHCYFKPLIFTFKII